VGELLAMARAGGACLKRQSLKLVEARHPQLSPLVRRDVLRVVEKPEYYVQSESQRERKFWRGETDPVEPDYIYLVGTCHVGRESAADVKEVIEAVRPQAVVVELCKKRSNIMTMTAERGGGDGDGEGPSVAATSTSGSGENDAGENWFERTSRQVLEEMLTGMTSRIGRELNVLPGLEFKQAYLSAKAIQAEVVLGDRPIDITLRRCWSKMTWQERAKLLFVLLQALTRGDEVSAAVATQIDSLEKEFDLDLVFDQVLEEFPSLEEPLFRERDRYMAWAVKRSKAVTNTRSVVGVVGRGHLAPVLEEIHRDYDAQHLSFDSVARKPDTLSR